MEAGVWWVRQLAKLKIVKANVCEKPAHKTESPTAAVTLAASVCHLVCAGFVSGHGNLLKLSTLGCSRTRVTCDITRTLRCDMQMQNSFNIVFMIFCAAE